MNLGFKDCKIACMNTFSVQITEIPPEYYGIFMRRGKRTITTTYCGVYWNVTEEEIQIIKDHFTGNRSAPILRQLKDCYCRFFIVVCGLCGVILFILLASCHDNACGEFFENIFIKIGFVTVEDNSNDPERQQELLAQKLFQEALNSNKSPKL